MKKIEFYLNVFHFCLYKTHYRLHLFANKINPAKLLLKIPLIKKRLEEKGIYDIERQAIDIAFGDKRFGLSIMVAGGLLWAFLVLISFSIINILFGLPDKNILYSPQLIVSIILSCGLSYIFVFKQDKYIKYFYEFEKWRKTDCRKYSLLTFGIVVLIFFLLIFSLKVRW